MDDLFSHTAHEQPAQSGAPMSGHHNEVNAFVARASQQRIGHSSFQDDGLDGQATHGEPSGLLLKILPRA